MKKLFRPSRGEVRLRPDAVPRRGRPTGLLRPKGASIVIAFLVLFLALPAVTNAYYNQFPDVASSHVNYQAIEYLRTRGLITAYRDGSFRPYTEMKRAEFVTMVVKAKGVSTDVYDYYDYRDCYSDVDEQWYADEVCYAFDRGWLGVFGKPFRPTRKVTAAQAREVIFEAFNVGYGDFENDYGSAINRGKVAQMLYDMMTGRLSYYNNYYPPVYAQSAPTTQKGYYYRSDSGNFYYYRPYGDPYYVPGDNYYYDPDYVPGRYYETSVITNPRSVRTPTGYPRPWVP